MNANGAPSHENDSILVQVADIAVEPCIFSSLQIHSEKVALYARKLLQGYEPALVIFYDGYQHWLGDDCHWLKALCMAKCVQVRCDVRAGTRAQAMRFLARANMSHIRSGSSIPDSRGDGNLQRYNCIRALASSKM